MNKARERKLSNAEEMHEMETGELNIGSYNIPKKDASNADDLNELFEKMQIAVVGKENNDGTSDQAVSSDESESEVGDADKELEYMEHDPNQVS